MPVEASPSLARMEAWGGALLRAMAGDASLQWSGQTLYRGTAPVALAAAHQSDVPARLADQRGLLDGASLRLRLSDAALHARHLPGDPVERLVFELLEQLRAESLAPEEWPGARANLHARFVHWSQAFADSGLTESSLGLLLFTVALTAWSRLSGHEPPEALADLAEATRAGLSAQLGAQWALLRRHRQDQQAFIAPALAISRWVGQAVRSAQEEAPRGAAGPRRRSSFALPLHFESQSLQAPPLALSGDSRAWAGSAHSYRVFTRAYDREAQAVELIRAAQLAEFRGQMDDELARSGLHAGRLARHLQQRLAVPRHDGWQFGLEDGHLDGSRLAQLVSDPQQRAIFRNELPRPVSDAAVALLLDCSGSMKAHARPLSLLVDLLGRALSMAGVPVDVLGFSTQAWNGGRARRDWQRAGQPHIPGRLNERLHIVFKDAARPWRHARHGIAALRRPDLFREGVDGEAVEWACERLLARPAQRRILLVISDGCPMDTATHQANDEHYLDQHLRQVIARHERAGDVQIRALGVGLDLGVFYRRRLAVDLREQIDEALLMDVAELICRP
ncbi:MAG: cobalt chelatase [Delftia acidovorans]|nr:cobalt chelatase [Delftia acidovorans]